jgi:DNA mismatch repair protein MutL
MPITQLSAHLVNKIAAGEVIERPASVVKELVENALDAGATRIDVVIEDGGKQLIQVTDNGCGMDQADAALAFRCHATSKLSGEEDLFAIHTMGFRGEALASIASVTHASIRTRRPEEQGGWEVIASGAAVNAPVPVAAPAGTTVTIRDLFFNTPARRRFLRTTNTEFGHITEQVTRLALPHPQVAFSLRHNGRETISLPPAETTHRRIADLFAADLAEHLLPMKPRTGDVSVQGYIGSPAGTRSSAKWQYTFLNGRYIRDRMINHAIREAYRGLSMPARYPTAFVFLEVDPADVDVNVHPTKVEVRFKESNRVYGELLSAMRETLNQADLRRNITSDPDRADPVIQDPGAWSPEAQIPGANLSDPQPSMRAALADFFQSAPPPQPRLSYPDAHGPSGGGQLPMPVPMRPNRVSAPPATSADIEADPEETTLPPRRWVLQVHDTYLVYQTAGGLAMVDQHALHERVLYNDFQRRLLSGDGLQGQAMLIPAVVNVSAQEQAMLAEAEDVLSKLGIAVEPFGPTSVAIQQFPTLLTERGVEGPAFLREVLDTLHDDETADEERLLESVLAVMSCKAAIKAGDPITQFEAEELLSAAAGIDKSSACPHGRPTTLHMTLAELEKPFMRRE